MVKHIPLFEFHTGVEPESHTSNYRRYWLQLEQSYSYHPTVIRELAHSTYLNPNILYC